MLSGLREFINPLSVTRASVPPMDAGLRPNDLLDSMMPLLGAERFEPDDVILRPGGVVWFSAGHGVHALDSAGTVTTIAGFEAPVGALAISGDMVLAAVEGRGIVSIGPTGEVTDRSVDSLVRSCVTDIAVVGDNTLIAAIGSRKHPASGWARALLTGDRSGALVVIDHAGVRELQGGLAWPSGVSADGTDSVLVSLSFDYRIERRALSQAAQSGAVVAGNLPFYPGRIRATADGWWVAAPFVRNRATELVLDEPALCADLANLVSEGEWPVPRLRLENLYREPMQLGQLRVLGVLKPWAPARSYGLVLFLGSDGRVRHSFHSRVGGERHGITGVATLDGRVVVAAQGARNLLDLREVKK